MEDVLGPEVRYRSFCVFSVETGCTAVIEGFWPQRFAPCIAWTISVLDSDRQKYLYLSLGSPLCSGRRMEHAAKGAQLDTAAGIESAVAHGKEVFLDVPGSCKTEQCRHKRKVVRQARPKASMD